MSAFLRCTLYWTLLVIVLVSMVMIILISYSSYWGMQYNKAIRLIEEKIIC